MSAHTVIKKTRRLPIKGETLVNAGDTVEPHTVVARALLPGIMQTVRVADQLGIEAKDLPNVLKVKVGDEVEKDQLIAESKGFMGLFKGQARSPIKGTVELIQGDFGHVGVREPPTVIEVLAYISGKVVEVLPEEGAIIETEGALIQGIFGVGGERQGTLMMIASSPDQALNAEDIPAQCEGKVLVGGSGVTAEAIRKAATNGALGIVVGGLKDSDLIAYLGRDIGVAITGQEDIPLSLIATEGFGNVRMADQTFELLKALEGRAVSINGATQIRAGVIRPEIIAPGHRPENLAARADGAQTLEIGGRIRAIREPYFGAIGRVTALPSDLVKVESGTLVRVLEAELEDGSRVTIPRANVEIIVEK